jgi:acyl carrier protein
MSADDRKLKEILVEVLLIDDAQYRDDFGPDEIETWDSLATVRIASAVESSFRYAMTPEEMVSLNLIGDIKKVLQHRRIAFV